MFKYKNRFLTLCALLPAITLTVGCSEQDHDNEIQKSINSLLLDLEIATTGSNLEGLEAVIQTASSVQPTSQSQKQSKAFLLSTAKEQLANLQFQLLSQDSVALSTIFELAKDQAVQASLLRSSADAIANAQEKSSPAKSQEISLQQISKQQKFDEQLTQANSKISDLNSKSKKAREESNTLRSKADSLLNEAEELGIVNGHSTYKTGAKTLRKSQQIGLGAADIDLQNQMQAQPLKEEAALELEAIASMLLGMQNTEKLLKQLQSTSIQNAADFRELADELDTLSAETMNAAITACSSLKDRWQKLSSLIQGAIQGSDRLRDVTRETKQTAAIWKLDLEWTLGQIEERKRALLNEELQAVQTLISQNILTSSTKWPDVSETIRSEIEQATVAAMSAYENAKLLASNTGAQANDLIDQLDRRLALLSGEILQPTAQAISPSTPMTSAEGFATPQDLIEAFNSSVAVADFTGQSKMPNINDYYESADPEAAKFVNFLHESVNVTGNALVAIRTHMGEDVFKQFIAENPLPAEQLIPPIDTSSISMIGDDSASARDISGKIMQLKKTSNGWRIFLSSKANADELAMASMMVEMLSPIFEAMKTATKKIQSGEINTLDQLNAEMMSAMGAGIGF